MNNAYNNEPFHDEDDYTFILDNTALVDEPDEDLPADIRKAGKKTKAASSTDASMRALYESVSGTMTTGNVKKQVRKKASHIQRVAELTPSTNQPDSLTEKNHDEYTHRSPVDEYVDDRAEPQTRLTPEVEQTARSTHALNQPEKSKPGSGENLIADAVKVSLSEKISTKAQAFISGKGGNWFFAVSLVLVIGVFLVFKIHRLSGIHSETNTQKAGNPSSFSSSNPSVSSMAQVNRNNIPVAGEGVIPDGNGLSAPDEVSQSVTAPVTPSSDMAQEKIAELSNKIEVINNRLDTLQSSIESMQMKLNPPIVPKAIPVKVLGVLQNQRDDRWHADVLVKGQVFDVVTGDTVAGVRMVKVSGNGVDYQNAS